MEIEKRAMKKVWEMTMEATVGMSQSPGETALKVVTHMLKEGTLVVQEGSRLDSNTVAATVLCTMSCTQLDHKSENLWSENSAGTVRRASQVEGRTKKKKSHPEGLRAWTKDRNQDPFVPVVEV